MDNGLVAFHSVFSDSIFEPSQLPAFQEGVMNWSPKEKTYETDLAVLQWVEELEQRVILSDLQIRVYRLALGRGLLKGVTLLGKICGSLLNQ